MNKRLITLLVTCLCLPALNVNADQQHKDKQSDNRPATSQNDSDSVRKAASQEGRGVSNSPSEHGQTVSESASQHGKAVSANAGHKVAGALATPAAPGADAALHLTTPVMGSLTPVAVVGIGVAVVAAGVAASNNGGGNGGGGNGNTATTGTTR